MLSADDINIFEERLISTVASADLPFSTVGKPQFQNFLHGLKIPSRKTVPGRILTTRLFRFREDIKKLAASNLALFNATAGLGEMASTSPLLRELMPIKRATYLIEQTCFESQLYMV
jgi:hypothetical protein